MAEIPNKSLEVTFDSTDHIDLEMEGGHLQVTSGSDEWIQANRIGLIGQEGDWRFDPREGMPWVDNGKLPAGRLSIMGGEADLELIKIYIYQQLDRDPRNESVEDVNVEWDERSTRSVRAEATIESVEGDIGEVEV